MVRLRKKKKDANCTKGQPRMPGTFGCDTNRTIWVSGSCEGLFQCGDGSQTRCAGSTRCVCSVRPAECRVNPRDHPPVAQQWAKPIVVVPAVYDEWRRGRPPWACPDVSQNYMVCPLYQRLDRAAARYVPNHGYEAGVYLRFVLDYYERLPELIVFLQADADSILSHSVANMINRFDLAQFRAKRVSFLPLIQARSLRNRSVDNWESVPHVEECWRNILDWFGRSEVFPKSQTPTVTFYPGNYFAVTREAILRYPHATWHRVYERLIVNNSCTGFGTDPALGKHHAAGAFEHLAHVIWGGHAATYAGPHWTMSQWGR